MTWDCNRLNSGQSVLWNLHVSNNVHWQNIDRIEFQGRRWSAHIQQNGSKLLLCIPSCNLHCLLVQLTVLREPQNLDTYSKMMLNFQKSFWTSNSHCLKKRRSQRHWTRKSSETSKPKQNKDLKQDLDGYVQQSENNQIGTQWSVGPFCTFDDLLLFFQNEHSIEVFLQRKDSNFVLYKKRREIVLHAEWSAKVKVRVLLIKSHIELATASCIAISNTIFSVAMSAVGQRQKKGHKKFGVQIKIQDSAELLIIMWLWYLLTEFSVRCSFRPVCSLCVVVLITT